MNHFSDGLFASWCQTRLVNIEWAEMTDPELWMDHGPQKYTETLNTQERHLALGGLPGWTGIPTLSDLSALSHL